MENKLKKYMWILPIIWMGVIFMFSHQPGKESAELSGGLVQLILGVLGFLGIQLDGSELHGMIRVMAHFTVFFVLGQLWYMALRCRDIPAGRAVIIAFCICLGYALFDEGHQYFIPGRACDINDVLVDTAGSGIALTIGWLLSKPKNKAAI